MKRFASVGGARVRAKFQTRVGEWVAERVADPLVVEEESAEPAEGTPKVKTDVKAEGKPAKPLTKPTPKAKPAKPTPPVSVRPADPTPIPFPLEETVRGISDGVLRTLEGNVQTTWRDILPAAMREAVKVESAAMATCEVQKLQGEHTAAKGQVKTAEKRALRLQETLEDTKWQKLEVEGELKHMREV